MFCDEAFTPGHHLKHRRHQLRVLEMDEEPETDSPDTPSASTPPTNQPTNLDTPQLSLQALMGTPNFQTMRVTGMHNKLFTVCMMVAAHTIS